MIVLGYSEEELKKLSDNSIDLIFTSPPYADRRKNTYGGIPENKYLEWFKPIAIELKRVLKNTGSFFINIKPHADNGERSLYVFELVLMLKKELGFSFVEEYCWTKRAFPTGTHGRFKNGFEPVYHFIKGDLKDITFNALACGSPISEENKSRSFRKNCKIPTNGSGMIVDRDNFKSIEIARPSNVINAHNVTNQFTSKMEHSAVFPEKLVEFFVKSFSNENDLILDPFAGSGTVGVVCEYLNRKYILIDKEESNFNLMHMRIKEKKLEIENHLKNGMLFL
jgi:site-specific DNA-methyltransferase (adenine-specific)/site-specific DNA-methyltransferase (cytosine-N4-specific)